ncbi:MAG: CpaF family protein [Candidatus Omnitrophica bacterium]|nr:CpaF family protein [Candidatus Omnitrophota bacterium]
MNVKDIKKEIQREISMWVGQKQNLTEEFIRQQAEKVFENLSKKFDMSGINKDKVIKSLSADFLGLGPLQKLMDDKDITEIMVNGPDKIFIEKNGKKILSDIKFEDLDQLRYIVEKMLTPSGRRVDESSPFVDFSLDDGSRVNVIIPPLAVGGAVITIRKFLRTINNLDDLVKLGTLDPRMAEFLVACLKAKRNILFSGATGSGKTTTMSALSSYIDEQERIVTIEDALELDLRQEHIVRLLTKAANIEGKGEITLRHLFSNTLRMRPTRIILGEIRGAEAVDYLQALNSGHGGCLAVIHSSTPADAVGRLETMFLYAGLSLPTSTIRKQIGSGLDLILQHEQYGDGSRKINHITEVEKGPDGAVLRDIFKYEAEDVDEKGAVRGHYKAINKPNFFDVFKKRGIKINEDIFKPD